ncbi:bifunctional folylpolyglutamate synthase/dihydrofolate synthase [Sphingomicrobium nitratireducens]|uniref:bifunctional folylpolyglutamate synthase/dihydrofolate synthase n=1 Tax=Sphingomicrobium nitratireducens TaxID=2964666 RepID=UPI00223F438D|nr:folylpolyglutamate synthase/dihydrofolate synthase family protein [Sphingomicrobium nitratireducens]
MTDGATSSHPAVQAQLERLGKLGMGGDVLGLERVTELCARLGNPQDRLPPVFHVAGTNGKGSTLAFLRAGLGAAGQRVHAFTSPHLVRFNERIRIAGTLIDDEALAPLLEEVIDAAEGMKVSFFEATTAAAFLAFSRSPADACLVEVGLGGRLDATNIVSPACTGIAGLGMDHMHFLGDTLAAIAGEKAGIAKAGVPLVTMDYPADADATIEARAAELAVPRYRKGRDWDISARGGALRYEDALGTLDLPSPALGGIHQVGNLGLATAMLRHQRVVETFDIAKGALAARWPARMHRLGPGPLTHGIEAKIILDGAHNPEAARMLADSLGDGPIVLMAGILRNRDYTAMLEAFRDRVTRFAGLPVPGHEDHDTKDLCAEANRIFGLSGSYPTGDVGQAFDWLRDTPPASGETVVVMGSLYLAGDILRRNEEWPV